MHTAALSRGLRRNAVYLPGFRYANMIRRAFLAGRYYAPSVRKIIRWLIDSREDLNFTYDLRNENLLTLACTISFVTGVSRTDVLSYIREAQQDEALLRHVVRQTASSLHGVRADAACRFGRRLGWYAMVRIAKPRVVVETGVDKGLGAVLLAAALLRNREEGFEGRYYGTDINPGAGWLLASPYDSAGRVIYGDSIASLNALQEQIDVFINDSDHSVSYESAEYRAIQPRLTRGSIILGDNSHCSAALMDFAIETGRDYLFFSEQPKDHWYPGAGIGFAFHGAEVIDRCQRVRRSEQVETGSSCSQAPG